MTPMLKSCLEEVRKPASFGTFAPPQKPPKMGSPPKFSATDTILKGQMIANTQKDELDQSVQLQQQSGVQKTAAEEKDDRITGSRMKQLAKNIAVIAPAAALGGFLGHLAAKGVKEKMGGPMKGRIGMAIGGLGLGGGAALARYMLSDIAQGKIRKAGKKDAS